jgi:hypothetical protein
MGVLMKNGEVVAYIFRQLKVHEKKAPSLNLELVTVVFVFKMWRHYLHESRFEE